MGAPATRAQARDMTTMGVERQATYRQVLAEPRFRLLFATRSLAIAADTLRMVALSILVFGLTGSPLMAAVAFGIGFAPQAVGGTMLGALADCVRPRLLITTGYGLEAATAAALALLGMPVWASMALVAAVAGLTPVFGGASARLVAEVLGGDAYVLGRSLSNIASSAAQLLGLAAGGITVATLGTRHALLVTAGCHLAAAAAVRLRLPDLVAAAEPAGRRRGSVLRQSLTGSRQLITDRAVRALMLAHWLPPAFVTGTEGLIVPYVALRGFPVGSAALLLACLPVGMIVGDLAVGRLLRPRTREMLTVPLMVTCGLPLLAFAAHPPLPAVAALLVITGVGLAYTLGIQRRFLDTVPEAMLGQAFGLQSTGLMTLQGVGPAGFGAVAQAISPGPAMTIAGAGAVATGLALRQWH